MDQPDDLPALPVRSGRAKGPAAVAGLTALVAGAVLAGASFAGPVPYAIAILAGQLALVGAWCAVTRPPGLAGTAVVGALTAIAADVVALATGERGAGPLVAVLACAFGATTFTQLARGAARRNVTEAFGGTLTVAVAAIALAATVILRRVEGADLVALIVLAAALGMVVARVTDLVLPHPAVRPEVPRGLVGLGLGSALAAGGSALAAAYWLDLSVGAATLVGWLVGTAAVLADLGVDLARAGRLAAGSRVTGGTAGAALGPLVALCVAAPIGYLVGLTL
ncbi:hypothetical protein [Cryptosporangium phraense]|uniref:Phosphatidate cytidylyltransferase n=1 Tax=Cryptosporangium phraense TaxID=2593070 RepID=A0A545AHD1_9ACTN|nr:hypothetical protein [Cryptosporangium phraense]TQS40732.1 hypothetical protein FL583_33375 [Cryptosporangium phraense]